MAAGMADQMALCSVLHSCHKLLVAFCFSPAIPVALFPPMPLPTFCFACYWSGANLSPSTEDPGRDHTLEVGKKKTVGKLCEPVVNTVLQNERLSPHAHCPPA